MDRSQCDFAVLEQHLRDLSQRQSRLRQSSHFEWLANPRPNYRRRNYRHGKWFGHQDESILEFKISKENGLEVIGPVDNNYTGIFTG